MGARMMYPASIRVTFVILSEKSVSIGWIAVNVSTDLGTGPLNFDDCFTLYHAPLSGSRFNLCSI